MGEKKEKEEIKSNSGLEEEQKEAPAKNKRKKEKREPNLLIKAVGKLGSAGVDTMALALSDGIQEGVSLGYKVVDEVMALRRSPSEYVRKKKGSISERIGGIKDGIGEAKDRTKSSIGDQVGKATDNIKNVGDGVKDGVKNIRLPENPLETIVDVTSRAKENVGETTRKVIEDNFASPPELMVYLPGLEGVLIGEYVPLARKKSEVVEIKRFAYGLFMDETTLPKNLRVGKGRSKLVRNALVSDFMKYGTTDVEELLKYLRDRRDTKYAKDDDPSCTIKEIELLEAETGQKIKENRKNYISSNPEGV